jgi:hypothetical protein
MLSEAKHLWLVGSLDSKATDLRFFSRNRGIRMTEYTAHEKKRTAA